MHTKPTPGTILHHLKMNRTELIVPSPDKFKVTPLTIKRATSLAKGALHTACYVHAFLGTNAVGEDLKAELPTWFEEHGKKIAGLGGKAPHDDLFEPALDEEGMMQDRPPTSRLNRIGIPHDIPHEIPSKITNDISHDIPNDIAYDIPNHIPNDIPHDVLHYVPHDISHDVLTGTCRIMQDCA